MNKFALRFSPSNPSVHHPYPVIENYERNASARRIFINHITVVLPYAEEVSGWYKDCEQRYEKERTALESYLRSRGEILPVGHEQFLDWFFTERHCEWVGGMPLPRVEDIDFFLFSEYRKAQIEEKLSINKSKEPISELTSSTVVKAERPESKDSLRVYAFMHAYLCDSDTEQPITRQNCQTYANIYGSKDGETMYQKYSQFSTKNKRVGSSGFAKDKAKKKLFERVVQLLKDNPKALEIAKKEYSQFLKNAGEDIVD